MARTDDEAEDFFRFLQFQALLRQPGTHRVTLPELQEYQRLLGKYGVYAIDAVLVGPPDPARTTRAVAILNTDCQAIPGERPLICPRSKPRLPPELLPGVERRCRELGRVGPGETILWVGRRAELETLCLWEQGCSCFGPGEQWERWGHAAAMLVGEVGPLLRQPHAGEGLAHALRRARSLVRVLQPLRNSHESSCGPRLPPREVNAALVGLSQALDIFEKHLAAGDSTATQAAPVGPAWERLASAADKFRAAAAGAWPGLSTPPLPLPARADSSESSQPSVARADAALGRLSFEPGAFVYRGHRQRLSGKPLLVLEALAKARGQALTLVALLKDYWGDTVVGQETVRSAVKSARAALCRAVRAAGVSCPHGFDPIPTADRGTGRTAWRLRLP